MMMMMMMVIMMMVVVLMLVMPTMKAIMTTRIIALHISGRKHFK